MSKIEERHSFISLGVSREAFQDVAVKHTSDDDSLEWYLHNHAHSDTRCNEQCQVVRSGKVEFVRPPNGRCAQLVRRVIWFLSGQHQRTGRTED